jgi:SanA protein
MDRSARSLRVAMRARRALAVAASVLASAVALANAVVVFGGGPRVSTGPFDCALVLGAGVRPDGSPSAVLRDRLEEALALYRDGRAPRLIVSGDHATASYDEPNAMRAYLVSRGVPPDAVFMDHAGLDTYSSVWRARHVFRARRVLVVTQQFHLPRAVWLARTLGMEAEGRPADRRAYQKGAWFQAREVASRTKAVLDVVVARTPRHAGPAIPLDGDGRLTGG